MFHFLLKPTCRFLLNLPFISHFEPRLTVTQREMKKKTKKQTKKTKLHKIKNPMKQVEEKSPRMPCSRLTQQLNVTQSFTADTKPTRSTMVPYCKGRKGACYCEKKTTCNIYLCYIILICRRSLHFWYQQRKTLSFCRSH